MFTSQILTVPSALPEKSVLPSPLNAKEATKFRMSLEGDAFLTRAHVPNLDGRVLTSGEKGLAVAAQRHGPDSGRMSLEGARSWPVPMSQSLML